MWLFGRRKVKIHEIDPDEIFLDSSNLPSHNKKQFEGRVERPVSGRAIWSVGIAFALVASAFTVRAYNLEVANGEVYSDISRNNILTRTLIFAGRGVIYDRNGSELAWNQASDLTKNESIGNYAAASSSFAFRKYSQLAGLSHLIGFVRYPKTDSKGSWWREDYAGISGAELAFDDVIKGQNGSTMVETDARGRVERENLISPPKN